VRFAKDQLPHSPGGHPRLIAASKHAEVCEAILDLQRKHVQLSDAFERVAKQQSVGRRKAVSARTIERIWQGRPRDTATDNDESKTPKDPPQT